MHGTSEELLIIQNVTQIQNKPVHNAWTFLHTANPNYVSVKLLSYLPECFVVCEGKYSANVLSEWDTMYAKYRNNADVEAKH